MDAVRRSSVTPTLSLAMHYEVLGSIAQVLMVLVLYGMPFLLIGWFVRTFAQMRHDQQRLLQLIVSIESEVRAQGDRSRWGHP